MKFAILAVGVLAIQETIEEFEVRIDDYILPLLPKCFENKSHGDHRWLDAAKCLFDDQHMIDTFGGFIYLDEDESPRITSECLSCVVDHGACFDPDDADSKMSSGAPCTRFEVAFINSRKPNASAALTEKLTAHKLALDGLWLSFQNSGEGIDEAYERLFEVRESFFID